MDFLPQTLIVERLLIAVDKILPALLENDDKKLLLNALEEFKGATIPSAIYLEEVHDLMANQNIMVTNKQAYSILEEAAFDIDLNYTSQAVEYHVNEFIINLTD